MLCYHLCQCHGMNAKATESSSTTEQNGRRSHVATFAKALDGRKQPIRGLWVRNGRFYAQLSVENPVTGEKRVRRVPLVNGDNEPVQTVAQAVAQMERLN